MKLSAIAVVFAAAFAAASPVMQREAAASEDTADAIAAAGPLEDRDVVEEGGAGGVDSFEGPVAGVNGTAELTERDLEARNAVLIQWKNTYPGAVVGGDSNITIWATGAARFRGHFHDAGYYSYDDAVICVLKDAKGRGYTFSKRGRMFGTPDPGSRDWNFDVSVTRPQIKANWVDIEKGTLRMYCSNHYARTIQQVDVLGWLWSLISTAGVTSSLITVV